jgi:hypothetical protein
MGKANEGGDKTNFSIAQMKETLLDPKVFSIFCFGVLVTIQSPVLTISGSGLHSFS